MTMENEGETQGAQVMDRERDDAGPKLMNPDLRASLETLPVRAVGGAQLQNFAQQIDYAKYMSRGREAVPKHLRENIGACLAVVDIATRFGFSPYMAANKTYIQNDRLCFESQLVHAMIECSGVLQKRLRAEWSGEGDERKCKVIGLLKGETEPHVYESPPLRELHPGHKDKDGKRYVLGSQLWDDKPDVQLFYNTSYDWARLWCPEVIMGIYTPEEMLRAERHEGPDNAKDVTDISERIRAAAQPAGTEGAGPAHIDTELDNIAAGGTGEAAGEPAGEGDQGAGAAQEATGGQPAKEAAAKKPKRERGTKKASPPAEAKAPTTGKPVDEPKPPTEAGGKPAKPAEPAKPPKAALPPKPKTIPQWDAYARAHIDAATGAAGLKQWWNDDRKLRNELGITKEERMPVEAVYLDTLDKLEKAGK